MFYRYQILKTSQKIRKQSIEKIFIDKIKRVNIFSRKSFLTGDIQYADISLIPGFLTYR